jgi:hypothetical protein
VFIKLSAAAAALFTAVPAAATLQPPPPPCAAGDVWASRGKAALAAPAKPAPSASPKTAAPASPTPWKPVYRSTGLDSFTGKQRESVAAQGVVWSIDTAGSGLSGDQALAALLGAGAAAGWKGSKGIVFFRARQGSQDGIADAAYRAIRPSAPAIAAQASAQAPAIAPAVAEPATASAMLVDATVIRLEGGTASAADLIARLPAEATLLPFGAGQIVRINAKDVAKFRQLVGEGHQLLLPASRLPLTPGAELGSAIGQCGSAALSRRLPTPKVRNAIGRMAILDVEGQSLLVQAGDLVAVVAGTGAIADLALMRLR